MSNSSPTVSIGMPVYNGERTLREALDTLLSQSFSDFELIISDNASVDGTAKICRHYAAQDKRIRYIRQSANVGPLANFKFVLNEAQAPYFVWVACDDKRSNDFLKDNIGFLEKNPEYSASASPNTFENWDKSTPLIDFSLKDEKYRRFIKFFKYCFQSHAIFYSVMRKDVLRKCKFINIENNEKDWLGFDWAIIIHLLIFGKINRVNGSNIIFGVYGQSSGMDVFKKYNSSKIEWIFPFYHFSLYVIKISACFTFLQRTRIVAQLLGLNLRAKYMPISAAARDLLYRLYQQITH